MSIVEKKVSKEDDKKVEYIEVVTEAISWGDSMCFDDANDWRTAIDTLLTRAQGTEVMARVKSICVSGTSATCVLVKQNSLEVSRKARMYNYDILSSSDEPSLSTRVMELINQYVPSKHTARATTGSLAKLLLWNEEEPLVNEVLCHQSDFVSMSLMHEGLDNSQCTVTSDWHNCLKLGYDVQRKEFPEWMSTLLKEGCNMDMSFCLPSKVISPGEAFGVIS